MLSLNPKSSCHILSTPTLYIVSFFLNCFPVSHTLRVQTNPESPAGIPVNGVTDFPGVRSWHLWAKWRDPHLGIHFKPSSYAPSSSVFFIKRISLISSCIFTVYPSFWSNNFKKKSDFIKYLFYITRTFGLIGCKYINVARSDKNEMDWRYASIERPHPTSWARTYI